MKFFDGLLNLITFSLFFLTSSFASVQPSSNLTLPFLTHCNASASWLPPGLDFNQIYPSCHDATFEFLRIADENAKQQFEFHSKGVKSKFVGLKDKSTPIRYNYRMYTISLHYNHFLLDLWIQKLSENTKHRILHHTH